MLQNGRLKYKKKYLAINNGEISFQLVKVPVLKIKYFTFLCKKEKVMLSTHVTESERQVHDR